jgi:hypothetical protein
MKKQLQESNPQDACASAQPKLGRPPVDQAAVITPCVQHDMKAEFEHETKTARQLMAASFDGKCCKGHDLRQRHTFLQAPFSTIRVLSAA